MKRLLTSVFSLLFLVQFTWAQCTISVTPSTPQICLGDCVTLHVSGADTYQWMPGGLSDSVVSLCPTATTTYTVTGTDALSNTCSAAVTVTVFVNLVPTFNPIWAICSGDPLAPLPTTSTNGITGTWAPALNNTATTTYTFTPTAGQCAASITKTIVVNPNIIPTFNPMGPYCAGSAIPVLPFTSTNGITGIWSPAINNTATTTYTFTPMAGQCATATTMTITILPLISPTINCGISTDSTIIFNWNALAGATGYSVSYFINATGPVNIGPIGNVLTYSVTGLTSSDIVSITVTPTGGAGACFTSSTASCTAIPCAPPTAHISYASPLCFGSGIQPVTLTGTGAYTGGTYTASPYYLSINGSTGAINTSTSTCGSYTVSYTVAGVGGCPGVTTTTQVTINCAITPTFNPIPAICAGSYVSLPMTSTNGITGSWIPVFNNSITATYTFTPTIGWCATAATLTITVKPNPVITATASPDSIYQGGFSTLTASSTVSGTNYIWTPGGGVGNPTIVQPALTTTYSVNGNANGCTGSNTVTVYVYDKFIHDVSGSTACHLPYLAVLDIFDGFVYPTDTINYYLNFGDGSDTTFNMIYNNNPVPLASVTHIYNTTGIYSPSAILQHTNGLTDTIYAPNLIIAADSCGDISGKVFVDQNMNCVADSGEFMMSNILIKLFDPSHTLIQIQFTDGQGFYSFYVPNGNYTVEIDSSIYANSTLYCPAGGNYSITGIPAMNRNFGLNYMPGFDLYGLMNGSGFRPNFNSYLYLTVGNHNNVLTNAYVQLVLDPLTTYITSTLAPSTINGDTLNWVINNLSASGLSHKYFSVNVHTSNLAVVNDSLSFSLTVSPLAGDLYLPNNFINKKFRVTNSYDPNEKEVSPAGVISQITELTYTIHFQNTGTAEAYNIYILDTLDDNLDMNTLELLGSSHTYYAEIIQTNQKNILKFLFPDIMLPDSGTNQMLSNGYVSYRISPLANSPEGTYIYNTADIYFDYNAAIATNTVQNVIPLSTSIDQINEPTSIDRLYPNPADQQATITFSLPEKGETSIEVFDITGKRCMTLLQKEFEAGLHQLNFTVEDLNPGLYFIRINGNGHLSVLKLVKIGL